MEYEKFLLARPIWAKNIKENKNVRLKLSADIQRNGADTLKIATSGFYQLFINNEYVAFGPARAGRGYFRIDEIEIKSKLKLEKNIIEIILVSYGVDNYSNINQEPFVSCEVNKSNKCIYATGGRGFSLYGLKDYVQSISRYSFQRGFAESYIIDDKDTAELLSIQICDEKQYIKRNVPYPEYEKMYLDEFLFKGNVCIKKRNDYIELQSERMGPEKSMQFWPPEESMTKELQELDFSDMTIFSGNTAKLSRGKTVVGKFEREGTGMVSFKCKATEDSIIYVTYDEKLSDNNTVFAQRGGCNAGIKYCIKKGEYTLINFEPISMKYICFSVISGNVSVTDVALVEYKHPPVQKLMIIEDKQLKQILDAAVETFRQNAVDIFMDCPSRERAGWLCDSYFSGKAERYITGENLIEKNFLENFLMEENFKYLPDGMFPMCYPADHLNESYIPNWAMWFVVELADYYKRTDDCELVKAFKNKILGLVEYFSLYENEDGLLEHLDKWVFIDWSESNANVQDVNFPSNMMYAYMLECIDFLYNDAKLKDKAEKIRAKIRELSFDGEFFCDNLLKTESGYKRSGVCTESCQYYAFFTNTATKETHSQLWDLLVNDFGFQREKNNKYPHIPPSNAFIGNYIRLELFLENGLYEKLLSDVKGYFGYMAESTGTLWERVDDCASMNHGFAAYAAVWIYEAIKNIK